MALALDGNANATVFVNDSAVSSVNTPAMSTNNSDCIIYAVALVNGSITVSSITGTGLTFSQRTQSTAGTNNIFAWSATASGALSGVVLTVNLSGSSGFISVSAFAVTGGNTGSPFDGNASIPANNTSGTLSVSTSTADDFIIAGYRFGTEANPTEGTGFTKIHGQSFLLTEYKIVSATQSGLTLAIGTGNTDENGGVGDAIQIAGSGSSWGRLLSGHLNRLVIA